jgi:ubiquitin-conjugating enzyme E2 W
MTRNNMHTTIPMQHFCYVFFLLVATISRVHASMNNPPPLHLMTTASTTRKLPLASYQQQIQHQLHSNDDISASLLSSNVVPWLELRGGARQEVDLQSSRKAGFLTRSLRSLVHSILATTESISPLLATIFKSFIRVLETALGVRLLPATNIKKPLAAPKKKQIRVVMQEESTVEKAPSSQTSTTAIKKKKKKSSSTVSSEKTSNISSDEDTVPSSKTSVASKAVKEEQTSDTTRTKSSSSSTKKKVSPQALKHVDKKIPLNNPNYRIQRELKEFIKDPPPNLSVNVGANLRVWVVTMKGAPGSIYEGETFKLRIRFPDQYPTVPPSVYFMPPHIPIHEHVYTNGDICLSLLGKDWRPTMTAQSIAVSILSILSSAQSKCLPMDNARHALNKPGEYQKDWVYHDDQC